MRDNLPDWIWRVFKEHGFALKADNIPANLNEHSKSNSRFRADRKYGVGSLVANVLVRPDGGYSFTLTPLDGLGAIAGDTISTDFDTEQGLDQALDPLVQSVGQALNPLKKI